MLVQYRQSQMPVANDSEAPKMQGRLTAETIADALDVMPDTETRTSPDLRGTGESLAEAPPEMTHAAAEVAGTDTQSASLSEEETQEGPAPESAAAEVSSWSSEVVAAPPPVTARPRTDSASAGSQPLPWQTPAAGASAAQKSYSLNERLAELSPSASQRIKAKFEAAKASYPPAELALVAIKDEKVLELHARSASGEWQFVHRYPVLAASGKVGPKLRQGDNQVPEGVYGIALLNPNSKYHVSMRVNYPNAFDREMAVKDGRTALGGDIMIHGKNVSKGCLAVGDAAAEELFVLVSGVGLPKVKLVIAPTDFRRSEVQTATNEGEPQWLPQLYRQVASAMTPYKAPPSNGLLSLLGL